MLFFFPGFRGRKSPTLIVSWIKADQYCCSDFPTLNKDDLLDKTLGVYQIELAERYTKEHMDEDGNYDYFVHQVHDNLIRCRVKSRFSRTRSHFVWLQHTPNHNGSTAILGWFCQ